MSNCWLNSYGKFGGATRRCFFSLSAKNLRGGGADNRPPAVRGLNLRMCVPFFPLSRLFLAIIFLWWWWWWWRRRSRLRSVGLLDGRSSRGPWSVSAGPQSSPSLGRRSPCVRLRGHLYRSAEMAHSSAIANLLDYTIHFSPQTLCRNSTKMLFNRS